MANLEDTVDESTALSSKFVIAFKNREDCNGKHVVIGKVVGAESFLVLNQLEKEGTKDGKPAQDCII